MESRNLTYYLSNIDYSGCSATTYDNVINFNLNIGENVKIKIEPCNVDNFTIIKSDSYSKMEVKYNYDSSNIKNVITNSKIHEFDSKIKINKISVKIHENIRETTTITMSFFLKNKKIKKENVKQLKKSPETISTFIDNISKTPSISDENITSIKKSYSDVSLFNDFDNIFLHNNNTINVSENNNIITLSENIVENNEINNYENNIIGSEKIDNTISSSKIINNTFNCVNVENTDNYNSNSFKKTSFVNKGYNNSGRLTKLIGQNFKKNKVIADNKHLTAKYQANNNLITIHQQNNDLITKYQPNNDLTTIHQSNNNLTTKYQPNNDLTINPQPNNDLTTIHQPNNDLTTIHQQNNDLTIKPQQNNDLTINPQPNNDLTTIHQPNNDLTIEPELNNDSTIEEKNNKEEQYVFLQNALNTINLNQQNSMVTNNNDFLKNKDMSINKITIIIPIISQNIKNLDTILLNNHNYILLNMLFDKTILNNKKYDKNNIIIIECYNNGYCSGLKKAFNALSRNYEKINNYNDCYVMLLNQNQEISKSTVDTFIKKIEKNKKLVISFGGYVFSDKSLLIGLFTTSSVVNYLSFNGLTFNGELLKDISIDINLEPFSGLEFDVYQQLKNVGCSFTTINNVLKNNNNIYEFTENNATNIVLNIQQKKNIERITKYLVAKWNILKVPYMYDYINNSNFKEVNLNSQEVISVEVLNFKKQINIIKQHSNNTNKKVYLVMACLDYQNAGGGEKWLMDTMHWLVNHNYIAVLFCFINNTIRKEFDKINFETEGDDLIYIQYPKADATLIQSIKLLEPVCISHQGTNREHYLNIAKALNIPFITGLCFWHDIINFTPKFNVNMLYSPLVKNTNFNRIFNECDYVYSSSKFVNDIVSRVHNTTFDIIETISNRDHYIINQNISSIGELSNNLSNNLSNDLQDKIYVTCVNIHFLKNGWIAKYLIENLDTSIPLLLINTENDGSIETIKKLMNERNARTKQYEHKSVLITHKIMNMIEIYKKIKILIVGSIVDETFCKVAYEGMKNKIPIVSTNCGNLVNLLDGYADFMPYRYIDWNEHNNKSVDKEIFENKIDDYNKNFWKTHIEQIYNNNVLLNCMSNRKPTNELNDEEIEEKFVSVVKNLKPKEKIPLIQNNIGILVPWTDQGLGIQGREYYLQLIAKGYTVFIMAFKPYFAETANKNEWNYPNVIHFDRSREDLNIGDVCKFINETHIFNMIFIEMCYKPLFKLVALFKEFGVRCIGIPNIETTRYPEIKDHQMFDHILCNNYMTLDLLRRTGLQNVDYLGFKINHPYFKPKTISNGIVDCVVNDENNKIKFVYDKTINFFVSGGLNSIVRKHIKTIADTFNTLKNETTVNNLILHIYIQGKEVPSGIFDYNNPNIIVDVSNKTYEDIAKINIQNDVCIHMGCHEGNGLGLFEAISVGTPVLTINNPPNNEIIIDGINGWTIGYTVHNLIDNCDAITYRSVLIDNELRKKILFIDKNYDRNSITNSVLEHITNENYSQLLANASTC